MTLKKVEKVTVLPVVTTLDIPTERVIRSALDVDLSGCVIVGTKADGALYFASSYADGGDAIWHLELAKLRLLGVEV